MRKGIALSGCIRIFIRREWLFQLLLALSGLTLGLIALDQRADVGTHGHEMRNVFLPSALYACGKGFINTEHHLFPALDAFLEGKRAQFTPDLLPDHVPEIPYDSFQSLHRHMIVLVGWTWRLFGVSWTVMRWLLAGLLALSAVLAYKVFRLGMNRHLAFAGALLFILSPTMLLYMHGLRSFSKVPFFLGVILILGQLLIGSLSTRSYWLRAALLGGLIGIGIGFRQDMAACLAPGILIVLSSSRGKAHWAVGERAVALVLLLLMFVLCARSVLDANRAYGTPAHDLLMGMAEFSDERLELRPASYVKSYAAKDNFIVSSINAYARRTDSPETILKNITTAYNRFGLRYVTEMLVLFPADFITRFHAAVLRGVTRFDLPLGLLSTGELLNPVYPASYVRHHLPGLIAAAVAVLLLFGRSYYHGAALLFLLLYFLGYTSILYNDLHVYHLGFVPLWCIGFSINQALRGICAIKKSRFQKTRVEWFLPSVKRMAIATFCIAMLLLLPLYIARGWQYSQVEALRARHANASLKPLETSAREIGAWVLVAPEEPLGGRTCAYPETLYQQPLPTPGDYLALKFKSSRKPRYFRIAYGMPHFGSDYSWLVRLLPEQHATDGTTAFFFPVYEQPAGMDGSAGNYFAGIAVPAAEADDFIGMYRVVDADAFRLWPALTVPEDARDFVGRQSLAWRIASLLPPHGYEPDAWEERTQLLALLESEHDEEVLASLWQRLPKDASLYLALAEAYGRQKNPTAAIAVYKDAILRFPRLDVFYIRLDALFRATLDTFQRAEQWRTLATQYPDNPDVHFWSGRAQMDIRALEDAHVFFTRAVTLAPEVSSFHCALGNLHYAMRDLDGALELFKKARLLTPSDLTLRYNMARALADTGMVEDALLGLQRILMRLPEAGPPAMLLDDLMIAHNTQEERIAFWQQLASVHPGALRPQWRLGMALEAAGSMDAAQEAYAKVVAASPFPTALLPETASAYLKLGETVQAVEILHSLLLRRPGEATAGELLDEILTHHGMPEDRATAWRELAATLPEAWLPRFYLGMALESAGDYDGALAAYRDAYARESNNPLVPLHLGAVLLKDKDTNQGTKYIEQAVLLDKQYAGRASDIFAAHAGRLRQTHEYKEAARWYRKALETCPSMLWHRVRLAETLEIQGLRMEAAGEYRAVLFEAPESPYSAERLDAILANDRAAEERVVVWREIVATHPAAAIPRQRLAMALETMGDYKSALLEYQHAYAEDEKNPLTMIRLGGMLLIFGDSGQGVSLIKDALTLNADYAGEAAAAYARFADKLRAEANYTEAAQWYRKAWETYPPLLWHRVYLAETLEAQGLFDEAVAEYRAVLLEAPESPYSAARLNAILIAQEPPEVRESVWREILEAHPEAKIPLQYLQSTPAPEDLP